MAGLPQQKAAGLPAAPPVAQPQVAGPAEVQQQVLPQQPGLPIPPGAVVSQGVSQNPGILPYGSTVQNLQQDQRAMNPMNRTEVQEVVAAARKRANEHIRLTNPTNWQEKIYQPHEQIPELLILIEALNYTLEPKKTDVLRQAKDMQVAISVFVPTGFIDPDTGKDPGRGIRCQWRRSYFEFVPWEARKVPIHVAIMLLNQIRSYKCSMNTITYTEPSTGRMIRRQEPLQDCERPQIGFLPFRDITEAEKNQLTDHSSRFASEVSRVQGQAGEGSFLLNMGPGGNGAAQIAQVQPVSGPAPGYQPTQMPSAPPPQAPGPQGQVAPPPQQQFVPPQMQPQGQLPSTPPPGPPPMTQGPLGNLKTAVPMDRVQTATPVSEVTESTFVPQTNLAAQGVPV